MVHQSPKIIQAVTALLVFSISLIAFQSKTFAEDVFNLSVEEYRTKGYEAQQKGDYRKALEFYTKADQMGLKDAPVYNDIGVIYEQLAVPERAEFYYLRAVQTDPEYLPPYTNLAYLYKSQGDTAKAIEYFQERYRRAEDGDPWKKRALQELYEIDPSLKYQIVNNELQTQEFQRAQKKQDDVALEVIRANKHYEQGEALLDEGKYAEAITELNRALTVTPDNPKILKALDWVYYRQNVEGIKERINTAVNKLDAGNVEAAREEFQNILSTLPKESIHKSE